MIRIRTMPAALAGAMLLALGGIALSSPASAATLVEVTNFGDNPGGARMHIYVPDVRPANPAIVVAMHGCGGSGPGFHSGSQFASLADQYGFIVIYPTATQQAGFGNCFDVWSEASKRRGGGSDPVSIASMVNYALQRHNGDRQRVFATGSSSGGMMTQALMALYPDLFKAGAAFMGVPFTCFANAADFPPTTSRCVNGQMDRTPQQWGDAVRQAFPGYTGTRPRVQLWHGTNDTLIPFQLLQEAIEQWTNVFGLSQTPTSTDTPQPNWNRRRYATTSGTVQVEAYSIQGAGHSLPMSGMAMAAIQFFGLDRGPSPSPSSPPPGSTTRYEAETSPAVCTGTIDSNWPGYSGSGFCNGNNAVNAYAQFTVSASVAGTATLRVRFANGTTTARPASLIVNGSTVQTLSFEGTSAWTTWVAKTLTVTLNAGSNTIRLNPTTANGLPNIDYLEVTTA